MLTSTGVLCLASNGDWRSRSLKKKLLRSHTWGRRSDWLLGWAVSYCTGELLTPSFLGANTLNGTHGGDRWARVLGGQIGWLSEPLHRFDADCYGSTNLRMQTHGKHEKIRPTETHHETDISPATATTMRKTATKRAPCVSPCSPEASYSSRNQ